MKKIFINKFSIIIAIITTGFVIWSAILNFTSVEGQRCGNFLQIILIAFFVYIIFNLCIHYLNIILNNNPDNISIRIILLIVGLVVWLGYFAGLLYILVAGLGFWGVCYI